MGNLMFSKNLIIAATIAATTVMAKKDQCSFPDPTTNFTEEGYKGNWYEIAKYQTAGGSFFEGDCVCTELIVFDSDDKYKVDNVCRKKTPSGPQTDAVAE